MQAPESALKRTFWRKTPPKSQKWLRDTLGEAYKAKLWRFFYQGNLEHIPPHPKTHIFAKNTPEKSELARGHLR